MSAYLREDRVLPIGIPFMEENVQGLTLFGAKVGRELAEEDGTALEGLMASLEFLLVASRTTGG